MRLRRIKLRGFRVFEELDWSFDQENLFVFIGENGSGKSAILDAIAIGLSHLTNRISSKNGRYNNQFLLRQTDINVDSDSCSIELEVEVDTNMVFTIQTAMKKGSSGSTYNITPEHDLNRWIDEIKKNEIKSLPVAVQFRVDRTNFSAIKSTTPKALHNPYLYTYVDAFTRRNTSFTSFQEWFINEETIENQIKVQRGELDFSSTSLSVIREALWTFLRALPDQNFGRLSVRRTNVNLKDGYRDQSGQYDEHLVIEKDGRLLPLESMSSGEKSVLLLVVEIARRLYLANLTHDAVEKPGIVLIDEIELHLHPQWQRFIIQGLRAAFPNLQLLISTHSPQTLSTVHRNCVVEVEQGELFNASIDPFGRDSNAILEEGMDTDKRPPIADDLIDRILSELSADKVNTQGVEAMVTELKSLVAAEDPVFLRIDALLNRRKMLAG